MPRTLLLVTVASLWMFGCTQPAPSQSASQGQAVPSSNAPSQAAAAQSAAPGATPTTAAVTTPTPPPLRQVTIPAGTSMSVTVLSTLASDTSKVEDSVKGALVKPVIVAGATALVEGTPLTGSVIAAKESGRVKGRASISFRFNEIVVNGESIKIQTASISREAAADTKGDVKKGAIGAGLGAVIGGVAGGGKGATIGAVAGGTGTVLATKGKEVSVPSGTVVTVRLQDPLSVMVPAQ